MTVTIGIHHITAIVGHPQENLTFYRDVLGLRFIKRTVNFDDPTTYHFYFGDDVGTPGTIITFFPWATAPRAIRGGGQVGTTIYSIPLGSMTFWKERLSQKGFQVQETIYFGQVHLGFEDPHGLAIELVEQPIASTHEFLPKDIPLVFAIQGFYGARLLSTHYEATAKTLVNLMGYRLIQEENGIQRYQSSANLGGIVDLVSHNVPSGTMGVGVVHHIAFRTNNLEEQLQWQADVQRYGLAVTPVRDRNYFTSIYFREHGQILFEIATDGPGFLVDEPQEELGMNLKLPPQYEPYRVLIESKVLPIT